MKQGVQPPWKQPGTASEERLHDPAVPPRYVPTRNGNICSSGNTYVHVQAARLMISERWKRASCHARMAA